MDHLAGDLLDFTRSRLGGGIPIVRAEMSMAKAPGSPGTHAGRWPAT